MGRALGGQIHSDRRADLVAALPEKRRLILQSIAIRIAQQMDVSVVSQHHELSIVAVLQIDRVGQLHRQLLHFKSRREHVDLRRGIGRSFDAFGGPADGSQAKENERAGKY